MENILIIDDEESICWGLSKLCEQMGHQCQTASSVENGLELLHEHDFSAIVMDVRLPGMDGLSAIQVFHEKLGKIPIITITAYGDLQTAITAVQNGAFEYIVKPFDLERVRNTIEQAIATHSIATTVAKDPALNADEPIGIVGASPVIQEIFKQIAYTTTTDSPVLITGESGTGKELTARSIHRFSARAKGPFVAVNIASLSPTLAESELFGYVKGAFTGAETDRVGLIQQASGGSLFLDEVAEIPLEIQVKLLRVLDSGEVIPVGSNQPVPTDFRLISATHQDLMSQVNHGDFRHDLFYRLRTFEIQLPPLRDRKEDIPALVEHFLRQVVQEDDISTSTEFMSELQRRNWPGNVRELRNVIERAAVLARGGIITPVHLTEPMPFESKSTKFVELDQQIRDLAQQWTKENWDDQSVTPLYEALLKIVDYSVFQTAFELSNRQYSAAARRLGIHRTTLKKKLESPPLDPLNNGDSD